MRPRGDVGRPGETLKEGSEARQRWSSPPCGGGGLAGPYLSARCKAAARGVAYPAGDGFLTS